MKTNPITVHELGSSSLVEDLADAVEHDTGARVYEACWDGRVSFYEVGAAPGESYIEARLPGGSVWRIRCTGEAQTV